MSLKLVSVNIEGNKHLDSVIAYLVREQADVVCLMEVPVESVELLAGERYPYHHFVQNDILGNTRGVPPLMTPTGVAILSRYPLSDIVTYGCGENPRIELASPDGLSSHMPAVIMASVIMGDTTYRIGAIHFTWTKGGAVTATQLKHVALLTQFLATQGDFVICGDFNIPRGNEAYQKLAKIYTDNIPAEIESTLDPVLHYANQEEHGKLKFVVDYVWSTPRYHVSDVRVESGVSDHYGIACTIDIV